MGCGMNKAQGAIVGVIVVVAGAIVTRLLVCPPWLEVRTFTVSARKDNPVRPGEYYDYYDEVIIERPIGRAFGTEEPRTDLEPTKKWRRDDRLLMAECTLVVSIAALLC